MLYDAAIAIDGERIVTVGPSSQVLSQHPDAERIDGRGKAVLPGFANCHTHFTLTISRGIQEDFSFPSTLRFPRNVGEYLSDEERVVMAQLGALEERMDQRGYLEGAEMATTFNMLRSNDLIWSFVVNNYLLGKDPFPFDLLYWNSDSTRLPATMHSYYLRNMYQKNLLVKPGGLTFDGVAIDLTTIETPTFMLSAKEDHIAPWKSTYAAVNLYAGPVKFVLAASGHIAGIVNPPQAGKYCYWTGSAKQNPQSPDTWFENAKRHDGSWWPDWDKWMQKSAGPKVKARKPGSGKLKALGDAPGEYVRVRSDGA